MAKSVTYSGTWVPAGPGDKGANLASAFAAHVAAQSAAGYTLVTYVVIQRSPLGIVCVWSM